MCRSLSHRLNCLSRLFLYHFLFCWSFLLSISLLVCRSFLLSISLLVCRSFLLSIGLLVCRSFLLSGLFFYFLCGSLHLSIGLLISLYCGFFLLSSFPFRIRFLGGLFFLGFFNFLSRLFFLGLFRFGFVHSLIGCLRLLLFYRLFLIGYLLVQIVLKRCNLRICHCNRHIAGEKSTNCDCSNHPDPKLFLIHFLSSF